MLKVGITGGIGSGKSTVCHIFTLLGIPVYQADLAARELMESDPGLMASLRSSFGEQVYRTGKIDRQFLGRIVFTHPESLQLLNGLVHPVVLRHAQDWINQQQGPYVIREAALMVESGAFRQVDLLVGISAPQPLRIRRAMKRDGLTREEVLQRIRQQMPEDQKMARCEYLLYNDEKQLLIPQVLDLHNQLLEKTKQLL
ncbi:MAG TPA: dephospho-CoA kinase [Chitinophagaceae bacterium]|nr:dephospho-CoA kinase [Chitinophagaceae bacterium]